MMLGVLVGAGLLAAASQAGLLAAGSAAGAPAGNRLTPVKVTPGAGGPATRFRLSFRTPAPIGRTGLVDRTDRLSVSARRRHGCRSSEVLTLAPASVHSQVRATLAPGAQGWCVGRFTGQIVEYQSVICGGGPVHACPEVVIAPATIARFRFTVARTAR